MSKPQPLKKLILICCRAKLYQGEKCRCAHMSNIILRNIRKYHNKLHSMKTVKIGKTPITYSSINAFVRSSKNANDTMNKTREAIVDGIINKKIPDEYFNRSRRWNLLCKAVESFVWDIFPCVDLNTQHVTCYQRGGRKYNYDFDFILKEGTEILETVHIELKFNAGNVDDTPQFASPMKPSQYMSKSFEEYHYTKVLPKITAVCVETHEIKMPNESEYMKQIHSNKPKCMAAHQKLYYEGCKGSSKFTHDSKAIAFYEAALEKSKAGIYDFIQETDLNHEKLTSYLMESQKGKIYMLYSNSKFVKQQIDVRDYIIVNVIKNPDKSRYECLTETGIKLNVLLRWKNGNGIAFPAFQIKSHRRSL